MHATYPIEVTVPMDHSLHGRAACYVVNKRFKSFEDLHARLTKVFQKVLHCSHEQQQQLTGAPPGVDAQAASEDLGA